MSRTVCKCGKGYSSAVDRLCGKCRQDKYAKHEYSKIGLRKGEGMTVYDETKLILLLNNHG